MNTRPLIGCLLLLALTACRAPAESTEAASYESNQSQNALMDGTPQAVGVLAFLNAPTTTLAVLDHEVPLNKRAAESLIAFRAGADGLFNTADDDSFETIEQVDAVKWVGPASIKRLVAYAQAQGWVPQGDDLLGVFDDVAFTVNEAKATLKLANFAPVSELDEDVPLDKRAAEAIVEARPIVTMTDLAEVYFVGPSAMLALRDYPKNPGLPNGATCTSHKECASGLCVGLTLSYDAWCDAASMADEFTIDESVQIPDGQAKGLAFDLDFSGLASVPVDVVMFIDVIHPNPADLVVALHQPGGGYELIWDHDPNPPYQVSAGPGIERDNMVNGTWTVEVIDTVSGNAGELRGLSLWLSSRWD